MVCENCGQRPAVVMMRPPTGGQQQTQATLQLCNHCASALTSGLGAGPFGSLESIFEATNGPRPRRDNVLASLSEMAQHVLSRAARLSVEWGQDRLRVEFLLMAVLQEVPELREALAQAGVRVDEYEQRVAEVIPRGEPRNLRNLALSSGVKKVLQIARFQSLQFGHNFIGPDHIALGILLEGESFASQFLNGPNIDPELLRQRVGGARPAGGIRQLGAGAAGARAVPGGGGADRLPPNLVKFSRDLTALAKAGELDPIIGREGEIQRVIRILSRKTKNNPVLIGEPGVGKTAIAEGLAQRIVTSDVPDILREKKVLALDLGAMLAGAKYRGDFEERLKNLMDETRRLKGIIILFIDEIHTVVGAGAGEGAMDAANMLKPALSRGELQCLGATTLDEYRKHIEKDAALERRFQPVIVPEPTPEQAIAILRGLRDSYEAHHRVKITDEAITASVELADRYISDRFLPDKAIDVMDEAAAMVRLSTHVAPGKMTEMQERIDQLEKEKEEDVAAERFEDAAGRREEIHRMQTELEALTREWHEKRGAVEPSVTAETIAAIVGEWTGIPAKRLAAEEQQRLIEMEKILQERVIGQEDAIRAVSEAVRRARTGLKDPNRPIGSFIFLGPTGVGKTETAKALAEYLFNDEQALVRLDMSEFQERHTVSRLVGAPPGYVGYEEAGKLTEAVRRRPYSVILFDEIEKAHPDVFNVLLQILDDGRLTDAKGRTVSFKNTVVIMTSNVGAEGLTYRKGRLGFQRDSEDVAERDRVRDAALNAMKAQFRPEFVNRIDEIVIFQALAEEQLSQIIDLMLESTRRKLRGQRVRLEVTDAGKKALVERGFDRHFGARPLRRVIQRELESAISDRMLRGEVSEGDKVIVDFTDGVFSFRVDRASHGEPLPAHPIV